MSTLRLWTDPETSEAAALLKAAALAEDACGQAVFAHQPTSAEAAR